MTRRRSRVVDATVGSTLARWLQRPIDRAARYLLGLLVVPAVWVWARCVQITGSVRGGTLLAVVVLALLVFAVVAGWRAARGAWVRGAAQRAVVEPGAAPHVLYRWHEDEALPMGLSCRCGKDRIPGELVYVGESNNVARRHGSDDDRLTACWFVPGVVGSMETFPSAHLAKMVEQRVIADEHPRENVVHAGRRR